MTEHEIYANRLRIGSRIAEVRELRHLTQEELALRTGLTQGNISRIEHGKYSVTLDVLFRIAQGLDCEIALILK